MKCKNCGAEISSDEKKCPYCECEVISETPKEEGASIVCPKCGSKKIDFKREEIGSKKGKKTRDVLYRTVGICQDCGHTWETNSSDNKKKHGIGWWILVVLFFPIALSVWFYKTDKIKLDKKYRIIILVVVWIILFIIGKASPSDGTTETKANDTTPAVVITESVDDADVAETNDLVDAQDDAIKEKTTITTTTTTTTETTTKKVSITDSGIVNPDFKKAMDSYEAFFDEYIAFMRKYKNAAPEEMIGMMSDYTNYMTRYSEMMDKLNDVDEDSLSTADYLYYMEVTARINSKLAAI